MKKIDGTVLKETKYISFWVLILSLLMQAVFLVIGKWDFSVLLGNILTSFAVIVNFLLMGITVQNALEKEEKEAKSLMRMSQMYRFLFLLVVIVVGVVLSCFNTWAVIIPVFFPRIAVMFRPVFDKNA